MMKKPSFKKIILCACALSFFGGGLRTIAAGNHPFPTCIRAEDSGVYRHRADGQAGRELIVRFEQSKLFDAADVHVAADGGKAEVFHFEASAEGREQVAVLLPAGVSVEKAAQVKLRLQSGGNKRDASIEVAAKRQWTVYILPHSHVDIGYTNTHANVEYIHRNNIQQAIKLARATAHYPKDARFKWDTEVAWPAERTLANGTREEKDAMLKAIAEGIIHVGAGYINDNTSVSADEEFDAFFGPAQEIGRMTGRKFKTLMQVDVPGMSWGTVTAAAQHDIPYVLMFINWGDRIGRTNDLSFYPFWWQGPDGKSKVLCIQPGGYGPGADIKGKHFWPQMMGQTDRSKLPVIIKTDNPREKFIDAYLWPTLAALERNPKYPYDIFPMSWAMADNMPIDADLPDAVKSWNEEYAYPHLVIATSDEIMETFDKKYGAVIPTRRGEFTECWTDGLGTAAKQTAMNRNSKELLIQNEVLWAMLQPGTPAPRDAFDAAWRNVLMGSEHTWCYSRPDQQPISGDILREKFAFFENARRDSETLLKRALAPVSDPQGKFLTVFNTLSWDRPGLVTLPDGVEGITDEKGNPLPTQKLSDGSRVFWADSVPAMGAKSYRLGKEAPQPGSALKVTETTLDNGIVRVSLNPGTGDIASITHAGKEFVKEGANSFSYLRGGQKPEQAEHPQAVKIRILEKGPSVISLMVESQAPGCVWLKREIRLLANNPRVEIIDTLDKLDVREKEGVHFGFAFDVANPVIRMDIPWGVVQVDKDFFPEANRNWICFQRWLDISGPQGGVTWVSPDAPLFQVGTMTANILGPASGSPEWLRELPQTATIYSWALNNHWHTNFQLSQSGVLRFRYAILPHVGDYNAADANRFGTEQARPLLATTTQNALNITPPVRIDNPQVVIAGVKAQADGLRVSLRSLSDQPEKVTLTRPNKEDKTITLPPHGVETLTLPR